MGGTGSRAEPLDHYFHVPNPRRRRWHFEWRGNGETTLVAQAEGPTLLTTLCTYLHRGVVEMENKEGRHVTVPLMKSSMLGVTAVAGVIYVGRGSVVLDVGTQSGER